MEEIVDLRQLPSQNNIKPIIVRGKSSKKNYQFNILAPFKLDMKACADAVGEKCEFEDAAVISERFGLSLGGIPPFGNLLNIDNYFDARICDLDQTAFFPGLATESILLSPKDLVQAADAKLGHFTKDS